MLKDLIEENKSLKKEYIKLERYQKELSNQLKNIQKLRAYKLWQKFNKIKKLLKSLIE